MKVKFYYVRHGETLFNQTERMQGACDSPLTKNGIEGAKDIASALCKVPFNSAYSSSSERAWDTAEMICKYHHIHPTLMKELKEFDFGELDGMHVKDMDLDVFESVFTDDWSEYQGENQEIFLKRSTAAFEKMIENSKDNDTVLIVSHGSFFMNILKSLLHEDREAYIKRRNAEGKSWMPNTGVSIFTYTDGVWEMKEEPMTADEYRIKHDPKTVDFYYVRHGETLFNKEYRLQGRCDSPLTEEGILQSHQAKDRLKDITFNSAYCSSSERTRDTAEILLEDKELNAIPDKRLREFFFGEYEGCLSEKYQDELNERVQTMHFLDKGGEDREDAEKRSHSVLQEIYDQSNDGDTVLLVSHGFFYLVLLQSLFGMDINQMFAESEAEGINPIPNCGIARFRCENGTYELEEMMR